MRVIQTTGAGGASSLEIQQVPLPKLMQNEVLIQVRAIGVNRMDLNRRDHNKVPQVLGVEVAGIISETKSPAFKVGRRVKALLDAGGYAEYVAVKATRVMPLPDALTFTDGAGIPEAFLTAYQTLFKLGHLAKKETVLIHAGASGVGTAAIQLAKQLAEAQVIVTAGSPKKLAFTQQLGADLAVNYHTEDFSRHVKLATKGRGVDVILDFIGQSYFQQNLTSMAVDGRWVLISALSGGQVTNVNLQQLIAKRISLLGTLLSPRSDHYKAELIQDFSQTVLPLIANGKIQPVIDRVFPFVAVGQAQEYMAGNHNIGKIILEVTPQ